MSGAAAVPAATSVFISYSRKDAEFVRRLHAAIDAPERKSWVDWEGIPPTAEWMREIVEAIDAAAAFVFVMSPDSLASPVCLQELDHAVRQNKRLVPLARRDAEPSSVPPPLARVNWIACRDRDDFSAAARTLIAAVETDLDWVKAHTRLLVRAREWEARGREPSLALRGAELKAAETWLTRGPTKEPRPTELQTRYVLESRRAATRRRSMLMGAAALASVAVAVLGTTTWLGRREAARQQTLAAAGRLTVDAELVRGRTATDAGQTDWLQRSLLLAAQAARALQTIDERSLQADIAIRRGLSLRPAPAATLTRDRSTFLQDVVFASDGRVVAAHQSPFGVESWYLDGRETPATDSTGGVQEAQLTADGRYVVAQALDGGIEIRDTTQFALVRRIPGLDAVHATVALSPDARLLVVCRSSERARAWALDDGVRELPSLPPMWGPRFSPDGRWLAGVAEGKPVAWQVETGGRWLPQALPELDGEVWALRFSADGSRLVVSSSTSEATLVSVGDWKEAGTFHSPGAVLAVSAGGRHAALRNGEFSVRVLDTADGREVARIHARARVGAVAFTPTGSRLAVAGLADAVELWQVGAGGSDVASVRVVSPVAAFAGDESSLLTFSGAAGVLTGSPVPPSTEGRRLDLGTADLAAFSADGRFVAAASGGRVSVFQTTDGVQERSVDYDGEATAVALSPDGRALAVALRDGTVVVWPPGDAPPARLTVKGEVEADALAVGPDGSIVAATAAGDSTRIGRPLVAYVWRLPGTTATTTPVGANRSGLVAAPCAFSVDARLVAIADGDGVAVSETETGRAVARVSHPGAGSACTFSADGRLLATAGSDAVRVWDVATQTERARIETEVQAEAASLPFLVRFSPRGRYLATLPPVGDARVWLLEPADLVALACARAGRDLTREEAREYFGAQVVPSPCQPSPPPAR